MMMLHREKSNTIPRMTQKDDQSGAAMLNSAGGSIEWQPGMKGE